MAAAVRERFDGQPIRVVEAGCGRKWALDLSGLDVRLVGVDINARSLEIRQETEGDLDEAIVGDLRTVDVGAESADVVYSSFVLEHVEGAEQVLDRCVEWLRPGGLLLLRVPDRDSVFGFITRVTPFWFHVFYRRRIRRNLHAGHAGYGPFPTVYDRVVSRRGLRAFARRRGLRVVGEYGSNAWLGGFGRKARLVDACVRIVAMLSFGKLAADHNNLVFVLEKP